MLDAKTERLVEWVAQTPARVVRMQFCSILLMILLSIPITMTLPPGRAQGELVPLGSALLMCSTLICWLISLLAMARREARAYQSTIASLATIPTKTLIRDSRGWARAARGLVAKILYLRWILYQEPAAGRFIRNQSWEVAEERRPRSYEEMQISFRAREPLAQGRKAMGLRVGIVASLCMAVPIPLLFQGYLRDLRVVGGELDYSPVSPFVRYVAAGGFVGGMLLMAVAAYVSRRRPLQTVPRGVTFPEMVDLWLSGKPEVYVDMRQFAKLKGRKSPHQDHIRLLGLELWEEEVKGRDLWPLFRVGDYRSP